MVIKMKNNTKCWLILITLYIIVISVSVTLKDYLIAIVASASFFSISMALLTNEQIDDCNKNRPSAMMYSFIPGLGHVYLHMYRSAVVFLLGHVAVITLILSMFASESEAVPSLMAIIGAIVCMEFMSLIDVERVCNNLQLPYTGYAYELKIKNYDLAYIITILISYMLGAVYSSYALVSNSSSDWEICTAILISWTILLIIGIITCIIQRRFSKDNLIMSRTTAKLYLYFGLIFSIICITSIIIFHKEYSVIAPVAFLICVSIPLTLAGYFGVKKDSYNIRCEETKKKETLL